MRTAQNGQKLRISPETRSRLERDVSDMKATLGTLATKDDVHEAVSPLERKIDKIFKALSWRKEPSVTA